MDFMYGVGLGVKIMCVIFRFMYWAEQEASHPCIKRAWMDGQHVEEFISKSHISTMAVSLTQFPLQ